MSDSPLFRLHQAPTFMRSVSAIVLLTFSLMVLAPTVLAAKTELNKASRSTTSQDDSAESQLSGTLQSLTAQLQAMEPQSQPAAQGKSRATAPKQAQTQTDHISLLRDLKQQLMAQDEQVQANFAHIETQLSDKQLPQVILDRHHQSVDKYRAEIKQLLEELDAIDTAKDDHDRQLKIQKALTHLKAQRNKRSQQPFDPKHLPFQNSKNKVRPPKETREELEELISSNEPVQVAALELTGAMLAQASPSLTPTDEDLLPTEDVQITDEIKALAAQLGYHPVNIYNWVRNNIEYLPTYGSIQGSQMTLESKRGNAFDTASLLISLLRASNIPARYSYGTVQIPIEKVMNWVGGVESLIAAIELLGQGGIPVTGIIQGGVIKYAKLEHIWVEGWVDYFPSRAAINKVGDSWVSMDASFKQYEINQGMDLKNNVPFDNQELIDLVIHSAIINEQEGSITGIDQNLIQTALDAYRAQIRTHIEQTKTNATVGDVIGNKKAQINSYPILASSLPYKRLQTTGNFSALPSHLRHQISFNFYASSIDQVLDNPSFTYQTSLPELRDQRVSFIYEPSTEADKTVLDTAFDNYQIQFAAYLVNVTPTLKIAGQRVAGSGSYTVGTDQVFTVTIQTPWYSHPRNYQVTSGDTWVLGVNPTGVTPQMFDKRTQAHDLSTGDHPDYIAEMFHQIIIGYWGELNAFKEFIATTEDIRHHQLPSHGFAGAPVSVIYNFGIPRWASYKTRSLDIKENFTSSVHSKNEAGKTKKYQLKTGMLASYLESGIYDQAFLMEPGLSMSAVTALKKASEESIPIYQITNDNIASVLPKLTVATEIKSDITNAINAGYIVMVSRDNITTANFTGAGYIITDPQTGSGSYRISGGRDGNNSGAPQSVYPLPQVPASPIIGIMVGSSLRTAGVGLAAESGVIMGIAIPASAEVAGGAATGASTGGPILAALVVTLMIASTQAQITEERYPRISQVFRHYTTGFAKGLILGSNMILASKDGDFGPGVYGVEPPDADITCPMTPDKTVIIHDRYNIPADPQRNAFIEVEITRAGYWNLVIDEQLNSKGAVETIYRLPFLYFGPFSVAIDYYNDC